MNNSTLREHIVARLREAILSAELAPGSRLQEVEIADRYETSRTPVREAFRQLETEGFLTIKPRRGAYVKAITAQDVREFYEIKALLEGFAAKQAAEALSEEQINHMERLNDELKRCYQEGNVSEMIAVHNEFHEIFVQACGNSRLSYLVKNLVEQFQRFRIALSHTDAIEDGIRLHEEIIAAFRSRDAELASRLVAENSSQGSFALLQTISGAAS